RGGVDAPGREDERRHRRGRRRAVGSYRAASKAPRVHGAGAGPPSRPAGVGDRADGLGGAEAARGPPGPRRGADGRSRGQTGRSVSGGRYAGGTGDERRGRMTTEGRSEEQTSG